jgi:hypothetical protein
VRVVSTVSCRHALSRSFVRYAQADFHEFEPVACPDAVYVNKSVASMKDAWTAAGGELSNDEELPDLLIVRSTMPTETPGAMANFLREVRADGN